ncbi:hypothetical protein QE429_000709 [Bacillus sp. SORGH_AS 510]|uniref:DUF3231 family protein n=1 Tax=Bacillus sp. SORGH_AS_0510 TaxID=3041771 RepID=UPI00278B26BF|nr:DUF3231 family protein [Bacillus sp. SORGH_AS_0510]MDQ1143882.1 hypothetical protein [Bacillus sp. SORGH_AS_0510]
MDYIKLTSTDIAALWKTHIQGTAERCFLQHFLQYLQDEEIKSIVEEAKALVDTIIGKIEGILEKENFPIPKGFSDKDVDLYAPALFTDLFALSFVYRGGQVKMPHFTNTLSKVSRLDIFEFLKECLYGETELHKKAFALMLSKGLYDAPPKMEYPKTIEFVQHEPTLINSWFGEKRPINCMEMAELFQDIERNATGLVLLKGLIQVSKNKEIKEYLLKGKNLAENQIKTFNKLLDENDNFIGTPVPLEVTNSTISPFSEKLIMFFVSSANSIAISTLGDALSVSLRKDIAATFTLFFMEVMKYGDEGLKLMIKRGWLEQPPQPIDRRGFYQ